MRNLKSKLSLLLAISLATSPTVVFAQETGKREAAIAIELMETRPVQISSSVYVPVTTIQLPINKALESADRMRNALSDLNKLTYYNKKSEAGGFEEYNTELSKIAESLPTSACKMLGDILNVEKVISKVEKYPSKPRNPKSFSDLLKGTYEKQEKGSYLTFVDTTMFYFDKDEEMLEYATNFFKDGDLDKFENDCKKTMAGNIHRLRLSKLIEGTSTSFKSKASLSETIYSESNTDKAGCLLSNSGLQGNGVYYKTSCNEGAEFVNDSDFTKLINAFALYPSPYEIYGTNNFCTTCMEMKYNSSVPKPLVSFETKKADLKKQFAKKTAEEKTKAALMKFSGHIEDILKSAINRGVKKDSLAKDFYCINELKESLTKCQGGSETLSAVAKNLGLCEDAKNCATSDRKFVENIISSLEDKIQKRENGNSCQTLEFAQGSLIEKNFDNLRKSSALFENLKELDSSFFKEMVKNEMSSNKKLLDAVSASLAKLLFASNDNSIEAVELSRSPAGKKLVNALEKIQRKPEFRGLKTTLSARSLYQQEKEEESQSAKNEFETMASNIKWMLMKNMDVYPELKEAFANDKKFFSEFEFGEKNNKSFYEKITSNDYSSFKSVMADKTKNVCGELKKELAVSLCISSDSLADNIKMSPSDLKDIASSIAGENPIRENETALSSLTCELNNNLEMSSAKTLGDPVKYIDSPSNFAFANSATPNDVLQDQLNINDAICSEYLKDGQNLETINEARIARLKRVNGGEISSSERRSIAASTQHASNQSQVMASTNGSSGAFMSLYNDITQEQNDYISNSSNGDVLYGGHNYSNNNKPIGSQVSSSLSSISNAYSSQTTGHSGDVGYTGSSSSDTSSYAAYGESDNSGASEVTPINPNLLGVTPVSTPSYYSSYYSTSSVNHNPTDPVRVNAIQNLNKQFPNELTPEDYNKLSSAELEELLKYANDSNAKEKLELEKEKALFEKEKENFKLKAELEAARAELARAQKQEAKEAVKDVKKISAEPLSGDNIAVISGSRNASKAYEGAISNINRNAAVNNVSNTDSYGSNDVAQTSRGFSGGSVAGNQNMNAALTYKHSSSFSTSSEGKAKVPYSEVDRYLSYIGEHNVAGNQIIKRNSQGELVELLIPNMKGELVPVDVSELSESELEALEQKVAELFENQEKAGVLVADGVNVNTGRGIASVESLEEKVAKLEIEVGQEAHLRDLKTKILESILKR